jgi:type IV pilus assembly protein PilA
VTREKDEGFTLIELLVVMIIIGILAAIAIPVFLTQKNKAKDTSAKSDLVSIATDINSVLVDGTAASLTITGSSGVYTIAGTDANGQAVSVTGNLSSGNSVNTHSKYTSASNSFCVEVDNSSSGTKTWKADTTSGNGTVVQGTCP